MFEIDFKHTLVRVGIGLPANIAVLKLLQNSRKILKIFVVILFVVSKTLGTFININ